MKHPVHIFYSTLAFFVLISVSSCGGGSSGGPDPLFGDQWHLKNTGQRGALIGEDLNVEPVWNSCAGGANCRGEEVNVVVVDDGIQVSHPDLNSNILPGQSYNYLTGSNNPTPLDLFNSSHGTSVAGIIAARDLNGIGVRGVAPRVNLLGYNLLEAGENDTNEADAMTRNRANIFVSNNSWGPPDGSGDIAPSTLLWKSAIDAGLSEGRNGLGTIYVWAGGNAGWVDNSNYDGMANYRGVIAVAAVDHRGQQTSYSESGANLLVSAPGGEFCEDGQLAISTTDLIGSNGSNPSVGVPDYENRDYTKCMNGTSAATPMVSGVVALMLQANPNLGWRDVREILAQTARKNDPSDLDWVTNGAGFNINHKYGFGVADAEAAVTAARAWPVLSTSQLTHSSALSIPDNTSIPEGATGRTDTINVSGSGISNIEYIEITLDTTHTYSGDLEIVLTNGTTISVLAQTHACPGRCTYNYDNWVFGSMRHLGESADGNWTLTVRDLAAEDIG
ncbi:MAG: S8 family serine peptidase, partial [Gammaproteobacteria bacterium]|nr:S8 family serine peptidase [Gammaproteobacteria bacterium]